MSLTAKQKRAAITAVATMLGALALSHGVPPDLVATLSTALVGFLLGWAHLDKPTDKT